MYRYVAERAVVHVGIADDRFTVAAAGGVAVEHGAGLADHGLRSPPSRALGRGRVRLAANGRLSIAVWLLAVSAAGMRCPGPAARGSLPGTPASSGPHNAYGGRGSSFQ